MENNIKEVIEMTDTIEDIKQDIKQEIQARKKTKSKLQKIENNIEMMPEKCKVIQSYKDEIVILFNGKCISFKLDNNTYKKDDMVEILYQGTIGKKNFKIKLK